MKRIAFFVEGQTEQFFINRLLLEIADNKSISTDLRILRGGKKISMYERSLPNDQYPVSKYENPTNPKYHALIYDCGGGSKIISDVNEMLDKLVRKGYTKIITLSDLYPKTDLLQLEQRLTSVLKKTNTIPISIVIAVREVEDWFLAECNHYTCIDASLVLDTTQIATLGFNPCIDDLTLRNTAAAEDLRNVYQLVGKTYNKTKDKAERTVECLDYANLYLNVRYKLAKLNELIVKIENFLT